MSGFDRNSALGLIEAFRNGDVAAVDAVAGVASVDQALVLKKSELRQSIFAILRASIEADLCPAHAFDVIQQTSAFLTGSAMRLAHEGEPVSWKAVEIMGSSIIETVAQGAGLIRTGRGTNRAERRRSARTHSDHQTRQ